MKAPFILNRFLIFFIFSKCIDLFSQRASPTLILCFYFYICSNPKEGIYMGFNQTPGSCINPSENRPGQNLQLSDSLRSSLQDLNPDRKLPAKGQQGDTQTTGDLLIYEKLKGNAGNVVCGRD